MPFIPTWSPFSTAGNAPSTTPPALFFPQLSPVGSVADLQFQPTKLVTPAASEIVFLVPGLAWVFGARFYVYTLTAGAVAADSTHVLPNDYDAATNAKHWFQTFAGYIGTPLIDQNGDVLVDGAGNVLSFT